MSGAAFAEPDKENAQPRGAARPSAQPGNAAAAPAAKKAKLTAPRRFINIESQICAWAALVQILSVLARRHLRRTKYSWKVSAFVRLVKQYLARCACLLVSSGQHFGTGSTAFSHVRCPSLSQMFLYAVSLTCLCPQPAISNLEQTAALSCASLLAAIPVAIEFTD